MEDTFGKIVAIFICVMQMFFIPLYVYSENIRRVEQTYIISEITYNVDNFRNTGIIDGEQYNNMRNRIYSMSKHYEINVTHCTHNEEISGSSGQYFNMVFYQGNIEDTLEDEGVYYLKKNDYINVYIEDANGNIVGCYGGSVKNEAY